MIKIIRKELEFFTQNRMIYSKKTDRENSEKRSRGKDWQGRKLSSILRYFIKIPDFVKIWKDFQQTFKK